MIKKFALWWLGGAKYDYSRWRSGASWDIPAESALREHGIELDKCLNIFDVARSLFGKVFWERDSFFSMYDTVSPPVELMMNGSDDCDGAAMLHAQAMEYVVGKKGWKSQIVSYLAKPWYLSHHFCILTDPEGNIWAVQPQPTKEFYEKYGERNQVIFGPYKTIDETVFKIANMYGATVEWYDIRNSKYEKV